MVGYRNIYCIKLTLHVILVVLTIVCIIVVIFCAVAMFMSIAGIIRSLSSSRRTPEESSADHSFEDYSSEDYSPEDYSPPQKYSSIDLSKDVENSSKLPLNVLPLLLLGFLGLTLPLEISFSFASTRFIMKSESSTLRNRLGIIFLL